MKDKIMGEVKLMTSEEHRKAHLGESYLRGFKAGQKHTHNPSKVSGICKDCGEQLMPEEVSND